VIVLAAILAQKVLGGAASLAWLPVLSLIIGLSFSGLAFVAHETLHGSLTHQPLIRNVVGCLGFLPFCVSPTLWVAWHNRVHHQNTNVAGRDPDAYPNLSEYQSDSGARLAVDLAAPRSNKLRGLITLLIGFSLQSAHMLTVAKKRQYLTPKKWRRALALSFLAALFWAIVALSMGPLAFVFVYLIPLLVANSVVMAFIITNHSLSPLTDKNDTLASSLTVTLPSWMNFLTLGFGYHVEHHLFPSLSNRHAPQVAQVLKRHFPTRYQSMPLGRALLLMFRTPRIYKDAHLLVDPATGVTWTTLSPTTGVEPLAPVPSTGRAPIERATVIHLPQPAVRRQMISTIPPPFHSL
jgi:fatty acid desaturase